MHLLEKRGVKFTVINRQLNMLDCYEINAIKSLCQYPIKFIILALRQLCKCFVHVCVSTHNVSDSDPWST